MSIEITMCFENLKGGMLGGSTQMKNLKNRIRMRKFFSVMCCLHYYLTRTSRDQELITVSACSCLRQGMTMLRASTASVNPIANLSKANRATHFVQTDHGKP